MAILNYMDRVGLQALWNKITDKLSSKLDAPANGENGQVLTKTDAGIEWGNVPEPDVPKATETVYGIVKFASDSDFDDYMGISTQSLSEKISSFSRRLGVMESKISVDNSIQESGQ